MTVPRDAKDREPGAISPPPPQSSSPQRSLDSTWHFPYEVILRGRATLCSVAYLPYLPYRHHALLYAASSDERLSSPQPITSPFPLALMLYFGGAGTHPRDRRRIFPLSPSPNGDSREMYRREIPGHARDPPTRRNYCALFFSPCPSPSYPCPCSRPCACACPLASVSQL